jgi:hypothetical protein
VGGFSGVVDPARAGEGWMAGAGAGDGNDRRMHQRDKAGRRDRKHRDRKHRDRKHRDRKHRDREDKEAP